MLSKDYKIKEIELTEIYNDQNKDQRSLVKCLMTQGQQLSNWKVKEKKYYYKWKIKKWSQLI